MLDTANIRFSTEQNLDSISTIWNRRFKTSHSSSGKKITVDLRKENKGEWKWINKLIAVPKGNRTEIQIDFSYPRFFYEDNIKLVNSEKDFDRVNNRLLKFAKYITLDNNLDKDYFEFTRIDVAKQFHTVFEDYYDVFKFLQTLIYKNVGEGTRESKSFLKINFGLDGDYSTGFRYKRASYCLTVYNKTAQMNLGYRPGGRSLMRIEQSFTPGSFKAKKLYLKDLSVEFLRQGYKEISETLIFQFLKKELENSRCELKKIVEDVVKRGKIREELRLHDGKILDEQFVLSIIQHMDLDKSERMRYRYKQIVKDTLVPRGEIWRTPKGNLQRLQHFLFTVFEKSIEIELEKEEITVKKMNQP